MANAYLRDGAKEKARKMLRITEKKLNFELYEELIRLYGEAGEENDVYRTWMYNKKKTNEGFIALIGSLLKLGDIKGAEKMYYNEWECSCLEFDVRIPTMLLSGYREKGIVDKANQLMKKTMKKREFVIRITPLLEELRSQEEEKVIKPCELRDLIKDLCDSNQLSKALEASSWMIGKRFFNVFAEDYAAKFQLIENVLGLEEVEKFFRSSIPENMKDYSAYAKLLTSYTRSAKTLEKAETTFKKMRELGFLSKLSPFNSMISLYSKLKNPSNVENLVSEMKEKKIEPDCVTMNNVLRVYANEGKIKSMEKYKENVVKT